MYPPIGPPPAARATIVRDLGFDAMTTTTDQAAKPAVSERKREANRRNAGRSTGPKTAAGKKRSSLNALTHGLRAELVVLPDEDAAAFAAERDAFFEQWKPADPTQASFVERLAAGSWRLRRCVRVESARYTRLVHDAASAFDEKARNHLQGDLRLFMADPRRGVERLINYRAGVEQLFARWEVMVDALREPGRGTRSSITTRCSAGSDARTPPPTRRRSTTRARRRGAC